MISCGIVRSAQVTPSFTNPPTRIRSHANPIRVMAESRSPFLLASCFHLLVEVQEQEMVLVLQLRHAALPTGSSWKLSQK